MDTEELQAMAPLMLDDLAAALAPYGIDTDRPDHLIEALGNLAGALLALAESRGPHRRAELRALLSQALTHGRDVRLESCRTGCPCQEAA